MSGTFSHFFSFFSHVWRILNHHCLFYRFFVDFCSILGGFGEHFGTIFRCFSAFFGKIAILLKSLFSLREIAVFKDSGFLKTDKNPLEMDAKFAHEKNGSQKAQKMDLGQSWAPFGRGLGQSWASCGRSWGLFGRSWGALGALLGVLEAKMSSKRPSGWNLDRFGKVWGRFWEGLGRIWEGFLQGFCIFLSKMAILKKIAFYLGKTTIFKLSSFENSTKRHIKIMKKSFSKTKARKSLNYQIWEGLGLHLGGV